LDGVLREILVREGQTVEKDQILAQMDNRVAEAEVRLAQAICARSGAMARAEYELKLADNVLNRLLSVEDRQAVSELEVDQARSRRDEANAALAQAHEQALEARIQLDLALARLETHNVRAPFAGRILRIDARTGETVTEADPLLTLANLKTLRTELYVPIEWYPRLKVGQSYQLAASAPVDQRVSAILAAVAPVIDAATQTFRCVFEIDNDDLRLPAGFAVRFIRPTQDHPQPGT
jgi:RND family efflux transporter MFP subunit